MRSGFKHIWPTPSADCHYEGFACVFYSLLSPFGCLCFSKSHAPYGRVYFSLYVPGMHFERCCEKLAKAKARSLVPPVLLFNTSPNTHYHLWLKGWSPGRWLGGDDGPKLRLCDLPPTVSAGTTALRWLGMPLGRQLISWQRAKLCQRALLLRPTQASLWAASSRWGPCCRCRPLWISELRRPRGYLRMGRNSRKLSNQGKSAVSYKEAVSGQPLQVNSRCRVAEACWGPWGSMGPAWWAVEWQQSLLLLARDGLTALFGVG